MTRGLAKGDDTVDEHQRKRHAAHLFVVVSGGCFTETEVAQPRLQPSLLLLVGLSVHHRIGIGLTSPTNTKQQSVMHGGTEERHSLFRVDVWSLQP